ncbi:MAG: murein biosynthesis integral membrane protein MurJ [Opitutaceae bacterium]|nr:murein biosynthesis integral membrane protein MurJ [Opitutaceae bacterium]
MPNKLKNIGIVSALTIVSRVLGLVRDQLAAAILGASIINSAFITAFNLPNLFRRLLGEGALTAAFVPTLQFAIKDGGQESAFALLNRVASWLLLVCGVLVTVGVAVFSNSRLLEGHDDKWYLAADLTALLFPYLLLICVSAAFSAALHVMQRFTEPALSPIWLNLCMIASLGGAGLHWADTDLGRVYWLCAGVLVGGLLQMLVPAFTLVRIGWKPRLDLSIDNGVREIALLMAPGLFGTAVYQINIFISRTLAYSIDDSSATVFFLANRLMELPIGVFAVAVSTVVYPLIAKHAAAADFKAMGEDFRKGLRLILVINLPAAVGMALLSEPIVRLLFQHGRFTASDTAAMVDLVRWFVVAMPFYSVVSLTTRAFYAIKDMKTPVRAATWSFVVNVVLSLLLLAPLGASGLVISSTVAIIVQTVYLDRALAKRLPDLRFGELWRDVGKVIIGSLALAVVVQGGWLLLQFQFGQNRWKDVWAVAGLIPLGLVAYGLVIHQLKIPGVETLRLAVRRKLGLS